MRQVLLVSLSAALLLVLSATLLLAVTAEDIPYPPIDLASEIDVGEYEDGAIRYHDVYLSWRSFGSPKWLAAADAVIERRLWGESEWEEHLERTYSSYPGTFKFKVGLVLMGNSYYYRVKERAGPFETGYSPEFKVDIPMRTPELTELEYSPNPIPPGHSQPVYLTVHGKNFSYEVNRPENKPSKVLWDGEELPDFVAGHRIVAGWVQPEKLTNGRHTIRVVQGDVESKEPLYLEIGDVGETVEGLRATADPKKRKVYLDWKPLEGVDGYKVERREVVADPGPGAKALEVEAWATLVTLSEKVTKWRDRTGARDKHYQYRIAGLFADVVGETSKPEDAWVPAKRNKGKVEFDCWTGRWDLEFDGGYVLPGAILSRTFGGQMALAWGKPGTFTFGFAVLSRGRKIRSKSAFVGIDDGRVYHPVFRQTELDTDVRGKCAAWFEGAESNAYDRFYGELTPKKKNGEKLKGYTPILLEATAAHDKDFHPPETTLKTTLGVGKRTARPGDIVTIVVDVSCLGLAPLNADRVELLVKLENGSFVDAGTEGRGEFTGDLENDFFWVTLGDLGPAHGKMGHVERVIVLAAVTGPPDEEMRLRTGLLDRDPEALSKVTLSEVERVIEVAIIE